MSRNSWNCLAAWAVVLVCSIGTGLTHGSDGLWVIALALSFIPAWNASDY